MTNQPPPSSAQSVEGLRQRLSAIASAMCADDSYLVAPDDSAQLEASQALLRTQAAQLLEKDAEIERLKVTGRNLLDLFARPNESNFEAFERIAETFYRETGIMAPGKDAPAYGGQDDPAERRVKYDLWLERRRADFRAALEPK